ncbi:MAG: hypothetical protein CMQ20_06835 [Gammaproteobacteria bacterium]|jgi:hypothetical protein|nr:hypothetical protein [Gammaproteobacteria bacterium]|tara:strand:- start:26096 stop:26395 length:300 start_codon:yes stop_codon:yes gene_type:complete
MLYAIISTDIENSTPLRQQARPEHLQRLEVLKSEGRLVLAGPHPVIDSDDPDASEFSGSLVVAEFSSQDDPQSWADRDPYVAAGVYVEVMVKPFKKVLP